MLSDGLDMWIGREGAGRNRRAVSRGSTMTGLAGRALIDRKIWRREGMIGVRAAPMAARLAPIASAIEARSRAA
ncbi:MAG TPA: hypothetical protein VGU70_20935 [Methylobacterium sp.]|jgi:hypothetical protein|uniref:hypothetical protein n=1 Tax=Methylorubrum sp. B1-46 TaxID=2897334 RepID=UPI001E42FC84|nr:hypothetical protein [Methylorubrum sp. B1-46]UGB24674.1 hypothetical protein LPC10_17185 [Methylorubrum sp. B1-46]HEV2545220.1 hypothetical protein [Methylobacterium sp.]